MKKNPLESARHIVVEGPIGVGKTSLARRLADQLQAELLLEQPQANPFLAHFYQDQQRYALQTQLFFLFQRIDQLRELPPPELFQGTLVCDYLLEKDPLFAIESQFGRRRDYHHAPRTLDLDLLLYDDQVIDTPRLTLPHPRMHLRAFVLAPLVEIAPNCRIPGRGLASAWLPAASRQAIERLMP